MSPQKRPAPIVLSVALLAALLAACATGTTTTSPRTTLRPFPTDDGPTPATTLNTRPPTSVTATPARTASAPEGWIDEFCAAFGEAVIAQELVVDIGRALAEDARRDAAALSEELQVTARRAAEMFERLAEWDPATDAVARLVSLMGVAERMGERYERYIRRQRDAALERVQELIDEMRPVVVDVLGELDRLRASTALACPGLDLVLESP